MRDQQRISRILGMIEDHWRMYPDMRFGQLLINLGLMPDSIEYWKIEDDKVEKHLKRILNEYESERKQNTKKSN
jgi:hypothetical protein